MLVPTRCNAAPGRPREPQGFGDRERTRGRHGTAIERRRPARDRHRAPTPHHRRTLRAVGRQRPGGQARGDRARNRARAITAHGRESELCAFNAPGQAGPHRRDGAVDVPPALIHPAAQERPPTPDRALECTELVAAKGDTVQGLSKWTTPHYNHAFANQIHKHAAHRTTPQEPAFEVWPKPKARSSFSQSVLFAPQ